MKKNVFLLFLLLTILGVNLHTFAQSVTVTAKLDSAQMLIGEQTNITVSVNCDKSQRVLFPNLKDTLTNGVEIISVSPVQVQEVAGGRVEQIRVYTITAFDQNVYLIPPFKVKVNNKEYASKDLALKVLTVKVDTAHPDKFFGPKDVLNPPFTWADWALAFWMSIVFVPLAVLLVYLIVRYKDQKPIIRQIFMKPKLPPHQEAMNEIEGIKAEGVRLQEDPKAYYTKLTNVLRNYIRERYGFNAREMTSREIIDRLLQIKDDKAMAELRILFETSDLVKFARYNTLINENDKNLVSAIDFINQTKEEIDPNAKPQPRIVTVEEKRTKRSKMVLLACIAGAVILLIVIGYVIGERIYALCM